MGHFKFCGCTLIHNRLSYCLQNWGPHVTFATFPPLRCAACMLTTSSALHRSAQPGSLKLKWFTLLIKLRRRFKMLCFFFRFFLFLSSLGRPYFSQHMFSVCPKPWWVWSLCDGAPDGRFSDGAVAVDRWSSSTFSSLRDSFLCFSQSGDSRPKLQLLNCGVLAFTLKKKNPKWKR